MRSARRWLTAKLTLAVRSAAPTMPDAGIRLFHAWLRKFGPTMPLLAGHVRRNMRAAGLYNPTVHRAYFDQAGLHLANILRIFKDARRPEEIAALARDQIGLDDSILHLRDALSAGRGAVVAAPHVCNYVLTLARLNQEIPITVYLRWSHEPRKQELKHAWCRAVGLPVILEPPDAANPAGRAAACVEALRRGNALVMTPDIAQKDRDKGVPVRLFDHVPYLPAGPASIAMLAEAPLVPVFGRLERTDHPETPAKKSAYGYRHVITAAPPIYVPTFSRAEGGRQMALHRAMQTWADGFADFLRACPQAWFLWADSRWSSVFRGDPRYQGALPSSKGTNDGSDAPARHETEGIA